MNKVIAAVLIAAGLALGGWFVGNGFYQGRAAGRYVSVKGVAERSLTADLAIWPVRFVETGNDLKKVQEHIEADANQVMQFLQAQGIASARIRAENLDVTDLYARSYQSGPVKNRFIVAQTLLVRTNKIKVVRKASQHLSALVEKQVVISNQGPNGGGPYYLFTGLSKIKPKMIHQATVHARAAAQQFAEDSDSQLGGIRRANQGTFSILARDKAPGVSAQTEPLKTVRVVSHLQFYLNN
jgi:hypothetical protein